MLHDTERLMLFKKAIEQTVLTESPVVDIGTGTGILAAYSAHITSNNVYAIEYFDFSTILAQKLIALSSYKNIILLQNRSYDIQIKEPLEILITETIGQLGPEENMVEICYDFIKRHPSIKKIIPAKLALYAEVVSSQNGNDYINHIINGYLKASFHSFDYNHIKSDIQNHLACFMLQSDLTDAKVLSSPILLTEYHLGKTASALFTKHISILPEWQGALLHLYFDASLTEEIKLTSRFDQKNHWQHSFIPILSEKNKLTIAYQPTTNLFTFNWT